MGLVCPADSRRHGCSRTAVAKGRHVRRGTGRAWHRHRADDIEHDGQWLRKYFHRIRVGMEKCHLMRFLARWRGILARCLGSNLFLLHVSFRNLAALTVVGERFDNHG